jgi:DNA (cytosine-5)-methyltransferase 1
MPRVSRIGKTYYNDNNLMNTEWLKELVLNGVVSSGEIDARNIQEVKARDIAGFTRCHFFAGIGGWEYALRIAGWPDNRSVWTGSCPCQPFSCAGKGQGEKDPRHLWPQFRRLIAKCRPSTVFGEQVASKAGREWLSRVRADLEELGYAVGAADLCAAGEGSPHIRQRLYWVANTNRQRLSYNEGRAGSAKQNWWEVFASYTFNDGVCRRVPEPQIRLVVNGISSIPFAVRGYGNSIVPQVAATFISAFLDCGYN